MADMWKMCRSTTPSPTISLRILAYLAEELFVTGQVCITAVELNLHPSAEVAWWIHSMWNGTACILPPSRSAHLFHDCGFDLSR